MSETPEKPDKVEVGQILEGKVIRIKPFGAIVSLPDNSQGLVHISHVAASFVQNITDFVNEEDVVKVKVMSVDPETGKISLSMKEAAAPPARSSQSYDFRARSSKSPVDANSTFEEKFKEWQKISNERHAGLNKRNKRR